MGDLKEKCLPSTSVVSAYDHSVWLDRKHRLAVQFITSVTFV